jgi:hypothetical protein
MLILLLFWAGFTQFGVSQNVSKDVKDKVDFLVSDAYQSASAKFPCKVKSGGKLKLLQWSKVDGCLTKAYDSVDWDSLSQQLQKLQDEYRVSRADMLEAVESSLSAHAIPYEKVFMVKNIEALLPLSNTLLKFLPSESLIDLPVYEKVSCQKIGTFAGVYRYDKSGGLTAGNNYRMSIFQYKDLNDRMQAPSMASRLLLDSFGVPWKGAMSHPGFRLLSDRLALKR